MDDRPDNHRPARQHFPRYSRFIAVLVLALSVHGQAQERELYDPLLGRWDLTVAGEDEDYPSWMEIRLRSERSLMADFVGRFGSRRHASAVQYANGALEVRIPAQYEDGRELEFNGRLEDGVLKGHMQVDQGEPLAWTGRRAPALDRAGPVAWSSPENLLAGGLDGWTPRFGTQPGCWQIQDGVLSATPPCVDLLSRARFDDFRLSLEFRYPPESNSGVYLRGRYEVQIQDDAGMAVDWLRIGGIYGFIAPTVNAARAPGKWQQLAVELVGRRVSVSLNGQDIISDREIPGITGGALDSEEGSAGPLMLQGDHGPIEFRNVFVTPAL